MVIIEKFRELEGPSGKFVVLDLVSSEPTVKVSQGTGKAYLTVFRTSVSCTFQKEVAEILIGQKLPGRIEKVKVPDYEFRKPTGEIMILSHSYQYFPEPTMEEAVFSK